MGEESWHAARLIPTSGINGSEEQERRATSALLAVLVAVKEYGRALLHPLGAPAGTLEAYVEVPFEIGDKTVYPDGLLKAQRGQKTWTALVEVKTNNNELQPTQVEAYLDVAKDQGFDAVLTISNQIPPAPGQHPVAVDRRKLRKVALVHLSWVQVLSEAVMQKEHRGVGDPDQAWILDELIRYLEHPRSGAMAFEDMGSSWVPVREAVRSGTLRPGDKGVAEVVSRFDALMRYVGLRLGRQLGADVQPFLSRRELGDPTLRSQALLASLTSSGILSAALKIPDAVAPLQVTADLRAGTVACHVDVDAPRQGRPRTRVNWLTRQLRDVDDSLRLEAFAMHARGAGTAGLLGSVRNSPETLIADTAKELRSFRLTRITPLGTKRSAGRGSFISSVVEAVDSFYGDVLQNLKSWTPAPPRLREPDQPDPSSSPLALAASQDKADGSRPVAATNGPHQRIMAVSNLAQQEL